MTTRSKYLVVIACFVVAFSLAKQFDQETARRYQFISKVSYCDQKEIEDWTCTPCQTYAPKTQFISVYETTISKMQGLVVYDSEYDKIIVAFRGSSNIENWIANLFAWQEKPGPSKDFPGVGVHAGFLETYIEIQNFTIRSVDHALSLHPTASIDLTGHSLGGAVAVLAGADLAGNHKLPVEEIYTFGGPRIGNEAWAKLLKDNGITVWRLVHWDDPVPLLPPMLFSYHHSPAEVYYDEKFTSYRVCDDSGEDDRCSNRRIVDLSRSDLHTCYFHMSTNCNAREC